MKLYLLTITLLITGLSFNEKESELTTIVKTTVKGTLTAEELANKLKEAAANG